MKKCKIVLFLIGYFLTASSQEDTLKNSRSLDSVIVISYLNQNIVRPLPVVQGSYIFSGKKTEVIELAQIMTRVVNIGNRNHS
jgi:hypothetical protein